MLAKFQKLASTGPSHMQATDNFQDLEVFPPTFECLEDDLENDKERSGSNADA